MILLIGQIFFAITTVALVLLQEPAEDRVSYQSFFSPQGSKRGWEKITFFLVLLSIISFLSFSVLRLVI